jgi:hypothetical protein
MFISKLALPRRTFLRGVGAVIALPLLDSMTPAMTALAKTAASPVKRLGFIYTPNGATMSAWTPSGEGPALTEMSPTLAPLAALRDQVIVPTGLSQKQAESLGDGNGEHSRGQTVWLSGVSSARTRRSCRSRWRSNRTTWSATATTATAAFTGTRFRGAHRPPRCRWK